MLVGIPSWWVTCAGHPWLCREHSTAPSHKLTCCYFPWDPQGFGLCCAPLQPTVLAAGKWEGTEYPTLVTVPVLGPPRLPFGLWP